MFLPNPPTDGEKYWYVDQSKALFYSVATLSTTLLLIGSVFFAIRRPEFHWYLAFVVVMGFYLAIGYVIGIFSRPFNRRPHDELVSEFLYLNVTVDIFLPSCGEDLAIIANTLDHVSRINYPSYCLRIYVLDDAARPEVRRLAEEYGFFYVVRENRPYLKKSGNIRHAFKLSEGQFILILDADFCPRADFLKETIPYMLTDPHLGILQTPQFFQVPPSLGWLQKGASVVQELFYRMIQVNRDHWGAAICVGTCALYRRAALQAYGGTYPAPASEDVYTGVAVMRRGWRVRYIPINLAAGLSPSTVAGFFMQQYRWCSGSINLLFDRFFWSTRMTVMQRLCFLSGQFYYITTAAGLFLTPIPGLMMVYLYPDHVRWFNYAFSLPSFFFSILFMSYWNRSPYGLHVLKARHISYFAHFFALFDKTFGSFKEWVPTGNKAEIATNPRSLTCKSIIAGYLITLMFLSYFGAGLAMHGVWRWDFLPFLFFSTFTAYLSAWSLVE